ncbi:MAG: cell division protein SepF [Oscillospiraceae bacterium]
MGFLDTIKEAIGMGPEDDDRSDDYVNEQPNNYDRDDDPKTNRVVNISATAQLQVILVKPEVFADTKEIANHLNSKKTVVLNLESTTPDVTRRIIDFLGGVAYANGGNIKPVANNTFIITPYNVGFVGEDLVGELENNGVII